VLVHFLLRSQTLEEMFTPQFTSDNNGFGLGFSIGIFAGAKRFNHMGAVYGFTSILTAIPSEKIGVVGAVQRRHRDWSGAPAQRDCARADAFREERRGSQQADTFLREQRGIAKLCLVRTNRKVVGAN